MQVEEKKIHVYSIDWLIILAIEFKYLLRYTNVHDRFYFGWDLSIGFVGI